MNSNWGTVKLGAVKYKRVVMYVLIELAADKAAIQGSRDGVPAAIY